MVQRFWCVIFLSKISAKGRELLPVPTVSNIAVYFVPDFTLEPQDCEASSQNVCVSNRVSLLG